MRRRAAAVGIILLVALAAAAADAAPVQPGDPALDFALQDVDGKTHRLSAYRGKLVLLWFLGFNCSACRTAGPAVEQIWQDYRGTGRFRVIGLETWDETYPFRDNVEVFIEDTGATMTIVGLAYYLQNPPPTGYGLLYDNYALVDADGIVRYATQNESVVGNPLGRFREAELRAAIQIWLPSPVVSSTWSSIRGMYR